MKRYKPATVRQTIRTKVLGWTNTKPRRIKATTTNGQSVTIGIDAYDSLSDAHAGAALRLIDKLGLDWGDMVGGHLDGDTMVWVDTTGPVITATAEDERQ